MILAASNGDVVINEIMYNPTGGGDDEFLELYNTTASSINMTGWCFTDGITLVTGYTDPSCFDSGTVIAPHGFLVVSPNPNETLAKYGVTATASYAGTALSNGGETVTLQDNNAVTIDTVTYDDSAPWPTSPDGNGPSLELKDSSFDNDNATSWGASLSDGGTPGSENSLTSTDLPDVSDVNHLESVSATDSPVVTARVSNETTVQLVYKVMFDSDVSVTMYDDGNHGDHASGDGIYGASIPVQSAGSLVRYKVVAQNGNGSASSPGNNDSINYLGYIIDDGQTSNLPIVRWYMDPADFNDMVSNHLTDDQQFPAIFSIGGIVFDNSLVRVKGQSSVDFAKRKYKFNLPDGYEIGEPYFQYPVKDVSIQTYFLNLNDMQERLAWDAFSHYGFNDLQSFYVRVQKNNITENSSFFGHYLLIENYDGNWRKRNGYDTGALYKQASDKKTRLDEDNSDLQSFIDNLTNLQGQELKQYLLNNVDIPNVVNYNALSTITASQDWAFGGNLYQYRDTEGTGRWQVLPWDLDNAMAFSIFKNDGGIELDPLKVGDSEHQPYRILANAVFQFPEFREMYYRRLATLYDGLFDGGQVRTWFDQLWAKSNDEIDQDLNYWQAEKEAIYSTLFPDGFPYEYADDFPVNIGADVDAQLAADVTASQQQQIYEFALTRYTSRLADLRKQGKFPQRQPADARIVIDEFNYNPPGGSSDEYVELHNPNDYAVDVSGWYFSSGIDLTLPAASVIPAGGYALVVKNDSSYRSHFGGSTAVLAEYQGNLSNDGESITLNRADGSESSVVKYKSGNQDWSLLADGNGYSQALIRTTADETLAACWAPSSNEGTPGKANDRFDNEWLSSHQKECKNYGEQANLANTGENAEKAFSVAVALVMAGGCLYLEKLVFKKRNGIIKYD